MNELTLFDQEEIATQKWYTVEDLASLCGISTETLRKGNSPLSKLSIDFKVESKIQNMGGHRNVKFYSENVLKALKQYQLRNSAPNALKEKEIAIRGNVSFIANKVQSQTITAIQNDPTALLDLVAQSSKKLYELSIENAELKDINGKLMHTNKTYTATEIAKELGLTSANKLNLMLKEMGIQYKSNGTWVPMAKYADKDYYEIKQDVLDNGKVVYNSHITQKGREFILDIFQNKLAG